MRVPRTFVSDFDVDKHSAHKTSTSPSGFLTNKYYLLDFTVRCFIKEAVEVVDYTASVKSYVTNQLVMRAGSIVYAGHTYELAERITRDISDLLWDRLFWKKLAIMQETSGEAPGGRESAER